MALTGQVILFWSKLLWTVLRLSAGKHHQARACVPSALSLSSSQRASKAMRQPGYKHPHSFTLQMLPEHLPRSKPWLQVLGIQQQAKQAKPHAS